MLSNKEYHKIWYKKNKDKIRLYYREWYKKNGRSRNIDYAEAIREWRNNHPEIVKAHNILNYALKKGEIIKSDTCNNCNIKTRLSAHHSDYTKPLEVIWLCSSCHKLIH